jgi:hypothetical protein
VKRGAPDLRRLLLILLALGMLGVAGELLLLEHYEEFQQWIPLAALGPGLVSVAAALLRPARRTIAGLRLVMGLFIVVGATGLYLHLRGNAEFELEMDPSAGGVALVWAALTGATPALAPSAMIYLGLLGLAAAWRHPDS